MTFQKLLQHLGVAQLLTKCHPPSVTGTFLGFMVDSEKMLLSLPDQKREEITEVVGHTVGKKIIRKKTLQSVIGKLQFASAVLRMGRVFINNL